MIVVLTLVFSFFCLVAPWCAVDSRPRERSAEERLGAGGAHWDGPPRASI
jgi:hypothetical protein